MKMILGIAACDPQGTMGKGKQLPWDYPEDRRFFSYVTGRYPIVMGRKTWECLPKHHCVHRRVVVFSRHYPAASSCCTWIASLEEFDALTLPSPIFLIGGEEIFSLFLERNKVRGCFLTHIQQCYDGEICFPLSLLQEWGQTLIHRTKELKFCYYENYSYHDSDSLSK